MTRKGGGTVGAVVWDMGTFRGLAALWCLLRVPSLKLGPLPTVSRVVFEPVALGWLVMDH